MKDPISMRNQLFSTKTMFLLAIVTMGLFATIRASATDIFLRLGSDPVWLPGESRDSIFRGSDGWNDVSTFAWKVNSDSSWTNGGGASVGKPAPASVEITRRIDAASTGILAAMLGGKSIATGQLVVRDTSRLADKNAVETVLAYEFTALYFTSIKPIAASGETSSSESVSFVFKTIRMTYRPVDSSGNMGDPLVVTWDVPAGKVVGP